MGSVDISEFYDADERRRQSEEIEFGREWTSRDGVRFEVNWITDTGELYVMREPAPVELEDPFGGIYVSTSDRVPVDGMTVGVIGLINSREEVEQVLEGWEEAMAQPDSTAWLIGRLQAFGDDVPSENAPD
jgi:hypothetical protein